MNHNCQGLPLIKLSAFGQRTNHTNISVFPMSAPEYIKFTSIDTAATNRDIVPGMSETEQLWCPLLLTVVLLGLRLLYLHHYWILLVEYRG